MASQLHEKSHLKSHGGLKSQDVKNVSKIFALKNDHLW